MKVGNVGHYLVMVGVAGQVEEVAVVAEYWEEEEVEVVDDLEEEVDCVEEEVVASYLVVEEFENVGG